MRKTVEYYLSKGLDRKMAEYFSTGRRTIIDVSPNDNFTLTLTFDNGEKRIYDVASLIKPDTEFNMLKKEETFRRVYLDAQHCVAWDIEPEIDSEVVWNNKIDLCPDTCYVDSVPLTEIQT